MNLDGMILRPDGSKSYRQQMCAPSNQASTLGSALGAELLGLAGGRDFLFDGSEYASVVVKIDDVILLLIAAKHWPGNKNGAFALDNLAEWLKGKMMAKMTLIIRPQPDADRDVAPLMRFGVPALASPSMKKECVKHMNYLNQ